MVQVVGKAPEAVKQVTCRNCASILEYTQSEVTTTSHRDISGCNDTHSSIRCPVCNYDVTTN